MPSTARRADSRWQAALDEHRVALAAFHDAAERVPASAWQTPRAPGKWSPAQIAEHLALAYEAMLGELRGGPAMKPRAKPWQQTVFRWVVLPHVLFHRSIPRASSPREMRPPETGPDRAAVLHRLAQRADEMERELDRARRAGGGYLTHPYFGPVPPLKLLRFAGVHLDHHRKQLGVGAPRMV
jgi:DinB superfamily